MNLQRYFNMKELQGRAHQVLPGPIKDYLEGGADDELTLKRNRAAFNDYMIIPQHLTGVDQIDTSTTILSHSIDLPVILGPTGMSKLFHRDGEIAAARAASEAKTIYSLSTLSTVSIESIARSSTGPKIFQLYVFKDRGFTRELIQRCKSENYDAICLTADVPVPGNRERDLRSGLTIPPKLTTKSFLSFAMHPNWVVNALFRGGFELANVSQQKHLALDGQPISTVQYVAEQIDPSISWSDLEWVSKEWGGPVILKGVLSDKDASIAQELGVRCIFLSNHGGRQLDCVPSGLDVLKKILDVVGDDVDIVLDGGIRRGTDVVKAISIGAKAVSVGRPYLYGLAAGGQQGVSRSISILKTEIQRCMHLMGKSRLSDLDEECIRQC